MNALSSSQKRIIIVASILGGCLLFFSIFIYWPQQTKLEANKSELRRVDHEIQLIEGLVDKNVSIEEGIRLLRDEYSKMESKFPAREEEALSYLSEAARKYRIEVISVNSQPKQSITDNQEKNIMVDDKKLKKILVTMDLKSNYKDLVNYLDDLKTSLPAFMTAEKLKINKIDSNQSSLNVRLEFYLYLLS